ncbi:MAG TPA: hypothetical protein VFG62_13225 [Rhodopila sp.]|jgi:hypothetical protein|nr:hypothetical protein [Rhodopila sp.]
MPQGLSDSAAGRIAGVSHTAIRKARERGHLRTLSDGSVDPAGIDEWQAGRRTPRGGARLAQPRTADIHVDGPAAANARAAIALIEAEGVFATRQDAERYRDSFVARLKQIEYDLKSGSVVEIAAVTKVLGEQLARVRTRLLALPAEQSPKLHRCKTVAEMQDALLDMITRILEELSADGSRTV